MVITGKDPRFSIPETGMMYDWWAKCEKRLRQDLTKI
jgi:hypothetical protein